jgi:uncharacterized protein DUF4193
MPQELDDVEEPNGLAEDDLDELEDDDDLIEDEEVALVDEDDDDVVAKPDPEVDAADVVAVPAAAPAPAAPDEEEADEEEEPEDEDVEASLDMILKERLVVEEEPEDEEAVETDEKTDGVERVLPKQPDEFVCRSCFLVKHPSQLADRKKMLCRDCV